MKQNKFKLILASLTLILTLSSLLVLLKNSLNKNNSNLGDYLKFRYFIIYYDAIMTHGQDSLSNYHIG